MKRNKLNLDVMPTQSRRAVLITEPVVVPEEAPVVVAEVPLEVVFPKNALALEPEVKFIPERTPWCDGDPPCSGWWDITYEDDKRSIRGKRHWFDVNRGWRESTTHRKVLQWRGLKAPHPDGYNYHVECALRKVVDVPTRIRARLAA